MEMSEQFSPVALFVYSRPKHTQLTVEALLKNPEACNTPLVIFSDAAKGPADAGSVGLVREYLHTITGFKSIRIIERTSNMGLSRSITAGVGALCAEYGRVIVLEDDLLTSPDFLRFMNQGLDLYRDDAVVASIHGYAYPLGSDTAVPESYFLRGADCWGWATWARAWQHFESDGLKLKSMLQYQDLGYQFDFDGNSAYMKMLGNQIKGKNDSWAIRWHASAFLKNMLTLYPHQSLVANIGFDASGTHCAEADYFATDIGVGPASLKRVELAENQEMRARMVAFFRNLRRARYRNALGKLKSVARRRLVKMMGQFFR
ncbi:glycosyltransferase family 2 protein [Laribacter hongkongensis]|uniref:GNT-I family n=1 Tax=Laribacter hongkongensis TaxID=168471 RepID=A0A248LMB8_9NEIS|nr:glycosyltransferase [Laribacter hongkongensis]ASJ25639.1 GNT-I family [Laribacter hongkongensis]MCG9040724.1 glycosyltransferase [Laribacter hongkongensis]MCG9056240.1 glycosyltransferase [Laribacter hongkongensis]MCG9067880.1 glycosyltransferase [Laribacter hongkongensis]MCG9087444.1 glycosyltransferase [Laribacter hongkongensis]